MYQTLSEDFIAALDFCRRVPCGQDFAVEKWKVVCKFYCFHKTMILILSNGGVLRHRIYKIPHGLCATYYLIFFHMNGSVHVRQHTSVLDKGKEECACMQKWNNCCSFLKKILLHACMRMLNFLENKLHLNFPRSPSKTPSFPREKEKYVPIKSF